MDSYLINKWRVHEKLYTFRKRHGVNIMSELAHTHSVGRARMHAQHMLIIDLYIFHTLNANQYTYNTWRTRGHTDAHAYTHQHQFNAMIHN